jgi:hypothetical protein
MVNGHSITGHDPHNGEILWEYAWPDEFAKATQPLVIDTNRVFIAAGYGVGCVMLKVDRSAAGGFSGLTVRGWLFRVQSAALPEDKITRYFKTKGLPGRSVSGSRPGYETLSSAKEWRMSQPFFG